MEQKTSAILLDETGKVMLEALRAQTGYLHEVAMSYRPSIITDWEDVRAIVRSGRASDVFKVGDQLVTTWKDMSGPEPKPYEVPMDVVHFQNVTLQNGDVVPAMLLQWHFTTPTGVQFDHQENEHPTEETYDPKYSYYTADNKLMIEGSDYTNGSAIASPDTIFHSEIKDRTGNITKYGYNRWSQSAMRQWLNSKALAGKWWAPQHLGDVAPDQHNSVAGFMSGFSEDFLRCLRPIKVTTALNAVTEDGRLEDTYDTFFLPSLENMYTKTQATGEGEVFEYWKQAIGTVQPSEWYPKVYPAYITYAINAQTSPQSVRLRSAYRGNSFSAWSLYTTGSVYGSGAYDAFRCCPVCAIC